MKRKMTFFALGAKCGALGASGLVADGVESAARPSPGQQVRERDGLDSAAQVRKKLRAGLDAEKIAKVHFCFGAWAVLSAILTRLGLPPLVRTRNRAQFYLPHFLFVESNLDAFAFVQPRPALRRIACRRGCRDSPTRTHDSCRARCRSQLNSPLSSLVATRYRCA
jgi:hypothetical protein